MTGGEVERLRHGLAQIMAGCVAGTVGGDDVVWFSEIETLWEFCAGTLDPEGVVNWEVECSDPDAILASLTAQAEESSAEVEALRKERDHFAEWKAKWEDQADAFARRADTAEGQLAFMRDALERVTENFKRAVAGKPVRDMAETLAEVEAALASSPPARAVYPPVSRLDDGIAQRLGHLAQWLRGLRAAADDGDSSSQSAWSSVISAAGRQPELQGLTTERLADDLDALLRVPGHG